MKAGRCRPARPWGPIPSSVALVLGWWLIAHGSGQGWVQVLGDMVAAAVLVGLIGPWTVLRRIRVEAVEAPPDAVAGSPVAVSIRASAAVRLTAVSPARSEPALVTGSGARGTASTGVLVFVPPRHGLLESIDVEMATAAPFGLQWWSRRFVLRLPSTVHVAPRRGVSGSIDPFIPDDEAGADGGGRRAGTIGDLRAPRPYRPEDARRLIHWPSTAHTGELMVRELERPMGRPAEVVVKLASDPDEAETELEQAMGTVVTLLDHDVPVMLTTDEAGGSRTALVSEHREAARRLAAAV